MKTPKKTSPAKARKEAVALPHPPKERLEIKNFLVIKEAKFDVKQINIIFGPQSSGKSIVAKLLYFFRTVYSQTWAKPADFNRKIASQSFKRYIPDDTWSKQSFDIHYHNGDRTIRVWKSKPDDDLSVSFSKSWNSFFEAGEEFHKKMESENDGKSSFFYSSDQFVRFLEQKNVASTFLGQTSFIPALRSLYATVKSNTFNLFLSDKTSSIALDPFFLEFGRYLEMIRKESSPLLNVASKHETASLIADITKNVIKGDYLRENDEDWIAMKHGKVRVSNASSGQQEALPMLQALSTYPFLFGVDEKQMYCVEEPEAHLFPTSQSEVVRLITLISNAFGHSFVLTTHSPYILTALNNHIMAGNVIDSKKKGVKTKVEAIVGKYGALKYDDVGAYTIKDGVLVSAMDEESHLIDGDAIDTASEKLSDDFDTLLNLKYD